MKAPDAGGDPHPAQPAGVRAMSEIPPVRQTPPSPATVKIDPRRQPAADKKRNKRDNNRKPPPPTVHIDEYA